MPTYTKALAALCVSVPLVLAACRDDEPNPVPSPLPPPERPAEPPREQNDPVTPDGARSSSSAPAVPSATRHAGSLPARG